MAEEEGDVLDVHPPHHAVNGWRDFLIHIATITIGLLIALGLEGTVEWMHHRHIVREARADIRRELERNQAEAKKDVASVQANEQRMKQNLDTERRMRDHPSDHGRYSLSFNGEWSSFNSAAWRTARDTGALSYMDPDEVERYSEVYEQQDILNRQGVDIFVHQSDLVAPMIMENDDAAPRPDHMEAMMHDTAVNSLRVHVLSQLLQQLVDQYADTLKQ